MGESIKNCRTGPTDIVLHKCPWGPPLATNGLIRGRGHYRVFWGKKSARIQFKTKAYTGQTLWLQQGP